MREVRWERMFPDELETAFEKCPVVYLSYGLCEPHGPHNAVGLDALKLTLFAALLPRPTGGSWLRRITGTYMKLAGTPCGLPEGSAREGRG